MMGVTSRGVIVALLAAGLVSGCASMDSAKFSELKTQFKESWKRDAPWKPIGASEARVSLAAPGLEGVQATYARRVQGYETRELGKWRPGGAPWAELLLVSLSRASEFRFSSARAPALGDIAEQFIGGGAKSLDYVEDGRNDMGRLKYQRYQAGGEQCVVIRQYPGTAGTAALSRGGSDLGGKLLIGAYCAKGLSQDTVKQFIRGIVVS